MLFTIIGIGILPVPIYFIIGLLMFISIKKHCKTIIYDKRSIEI